MESTELQTVQSVAELRKMVAALRNQGRRIGLVPTMGALHAGHMSLVEKATQECDATVVSIFVNPTQFAPHEDYSNYPRPLEDDLARLREAKVDLAFTPAAREVYPPGFSCRVHPPVVARQLEGESRPSHFEGVSTVVLKLLNMVGPDVAYFGQKDYQQCLVIRHLVRDLNVPVQVAMCPIVRDEDGLALSSRNVYLNVEERSIALSIYRTLNETSALIRQGERDGRELMVQMTQSLIEAGVSETDYAVIADANTLEIQETVQFPTVLLIAARVGGTRLIDNLVLDSNA